MNQIALHWLQSKKKKSFFYIFVYNKTYSKSVWVGKYQWPLRGAHLVPQHVADLPLSPSSKATAKFLLKLGLSVALQIPSIL